MVLLPRIAVLALASGLCAAKVRTFGRHGASGTPTVASLSAHQATRERIMARAEKLTMASLFGREDCAIPEPSTGVCTCSPFYTICGGLCRDLMNDPDYCNSCAGACTGVDPRCCGGACFDVASNDNACGDCATTCDTGESCCNGACADTLRNPENCGSCGNECVAPNSCCSGTCVNLGADQNNCGICGYTCPPNYSCCPGGCYNLQSAYAHCGSCGHACGWTEFCQGGACVPEPT